MKRFFPDFILIALLATLSIFFYRHTISNWPSHIHAWTQGDRYALAIKFADSGLNLFKPRTYNLQTKDGITAVDLPIHDYVVGVLMYLSGSRIPFLFRFYTLVFSILGCWFLFRLARDASGSAIKGITAAVFVFTCPVITYYQTGFIPSATSFSLLLMGYFFYFRYQKEAKSNDFYWATGLMTVAALSRSPFNIFLFAILLHQALDWWQNRKIVRREALAFVSAFLVMAAANLYKVWLAQAYGSQFLGQLRPARSLEVLWQIMQSVQERWTFQFFTWGHYAVWILAVLFLMLRLIQKKCAPLTRRMLLHSGIALAGSLVYFALMASQFVDHEYYFMDSLYPGMLLLLVAGLTCMSDSRSLQGKILYTVMAAALVWGALDSKKVQDVKYSDKLSEQAETTRKNFIGAEMLLDSLQIPRDARLLVIDAWSTNIPLILMDRMGYTLMSTRRDVLTTAVDWDYDFAVVQDLYFPSDVVSNYPEFLARFARIGGNGRISVFKKNTVPRPAPLAEALGITTIWKSDSLEFQDIAGASAWQFDSLSTAAYRSPTQSGLLAKSREFGPTFQIETGASEGRRPFGKVLFEGWYRARVPGGKLHTVATLESNGQVDYYGGYAFNVDSVGAWQPFHALFYLPAAAPPGQRLKCYIWNPDGAEVYLDDFKVTLY